jgi:hypothetical protein
LRAATPSRHAIPLAGIDTLALAKAVLPPRCASTGRGRRHGSFVSRR